MASPPSPAVPTAPAGAILERGQTIDRFVVLGLVGRGGMGEVYAAYDPELDRKVAIKLLRARGGTSDGRARLLREAQAIAKLSHPSVVVVYDVGTFAENVFIAMEFVEGRTLSGWMLASARSRREIMQVFLAAGRGLSAAHAAGLVHRDFKPDNVMVTNDGQVRVMDFGLARHTGEAEVPAPELAAAVDAEGANAVETLDPAYDPDATVDLRKPGNADAQINTGKYLSLKLTQTGAMLGTPAYMAPEQFAVRATDARTDQFSFCVALYECLYGQRPFEGETFLALMTSVTTGTLRAPPAKTQVPGWMRKIVLRGLETEPDRRYPSMGALLAALETDPTVRTRRLAAGVGVVACLVLAVFGARRAVGPHQPMCQGGEARWAGTWEANGAPSARKEAIRRAFAATGKSYAGRAFAGAAHLFDDYVQKWLGMYTDACEATHVRGEQSSEVLDLRMTCLQQDLGSVAALSELFAQADGTVVENAVSASGELPRLERCADVASLRAVVKPPESEPVRKRVEGQRAEIARLGALRLAGHCNDAEVLAQDLIPRVRATGYLPLLAETLIGAGFLLDQCGDLHVGFARLKEAYTTAIAARDDAVAAESATYLAGLIADRTQDAATGRDWLAIARATLQRFDNHAVLDASFLNSEGIVLTAEGHGDEAVRILAQARDAKAKLFGPNNPEPIMAANNMGNALESAGRLGEAIVVFTQARDDLVRLLGAEHPQVAMVSNNLGETLNAVHRYGEALAAYGRAVDLWRKAGVAHAFLGYGLTGVGVALLGERRPEEAVKPLEEALAMRIETKADPAHLGETRFALARALWARPTTRPRALALARTARADYAQVKTDAATVATIDAWLAAPAARL